MDCFSSSTITDNVCYLNDEKCHNIIRTFLRYRCKVSPEPVRASANVNCYCIICIVQEFLASQTLSRVCYFIEKKYFFDIREVRSLLKT